MNANMERAPGRWLAFNVGCIECGVSSAVVGCFDTQAEAEAACHACDAVLSWREGGQNSFEVFDLCAPMAAEYRSAIDA